MKKEKIDAKKAVTTELSEFKKFISRGNVVDMAVGVIVGGAFGKINYGTLSSSYDELIDAATKLKDGEYSTSVITTELGYHVILKTKSYEKDTLENLKESILKTLADKYIKDNSSSVGLNALQHYRKEYGMEIQDDEIKKQYSNYIQNALASIASSTTK